MIVVDQERRDPYQQIKQTLTSDFKFSKLVYCNIKTINFKIVVNTISLSRTFNSHV